MKARYSSIQQGFTLIELIITIVIIGVLAAVAIPKFQDLTADAEKGVADGVAAALASATSVNYGRSKVPSAVAGTDFQNIFTCTGATNSLAAAAATLADVPAGYTVAGTGTLVASGSTASGVATAGCTITKTGASWSRPFNAYGAGTAP